MKSDGSLVPGWAKDGHSGTTYHFQEPIDWRGLVVMDVLKAEGFAVVDGKSYQTLFTFSGGGWAFVLDFVGDYREEIIYWNNGKVYVYTNTDTNTGKKASPWEQRSYRALKARTGYRTSEYGH